MGCAATAAVVAFLLEGLPFARFEVVRNMVMREWKDRG